MKNVLLSLTIIISYFSIAQTFEPSIEWRYHDIAPNVLSGTTVQAVSGSGVNTGSPQTHETSGEDWWYDIKNIYESNIHTGYIVCGFATWVNIEINESIAGGCANLNQGGSGVDCSRPILDGEKLSAKQMTVAKYNLKGNMIWCKAYSIADEGAIAIIQTTDGGFVFTGWGRG